MKGAITGSNWKMASPAKRVAPPIPVKTSEIDQRFVRLRKKTGSQACPLTFGGFPAKCLMLPIYVTVDATVKKRMLAQEPQMDTFRFGRRLSLPSTIAIKHQIRMLMADDRAKKAEEEARPQLTDIPQMKVSKASGQAAP